MARAAALILLGACSRQSDAPPPKDAPFASAGGPEVITPSPGVPVELVLPPGDSAVDVAASPHGHEVAILVRNAGKRARVVLWTLRKATPTPIAELPAGFEPRAIAARPAGTTYFVSGAIGGKSRIFSITNNAPDMWVTETVFETPRDVGRLIVSSRPFQTDTGTQYRLFFAAKLPRGGASLRSVNELGRVEYQVVGPESTTVKFPAGQEQPGGTTAPYGAPMSFHPRGQPMLWQDARGCTHAYAYDKSWTEDKPVAGIPCDGSTSIAPNGNAYVHWRSGRPGLTIISAAVGTSEQATQFTFVNAPVSVPDGRGVIGIVAKGSQSAVEYVPLDVPLADVANAWQHAPNRCEQDVFVREGGLFHDTNEQQLYSVYDRYNYTEPRVPFLATTDLFWDNFGAAFNGVFILSEQRRAMGAFWSFVDSANAAFARTAPDSKWTKAFAAISDSRKPNATGEAARIARSTKSERSTVVDSMFPFSELLPRGHYTSSPEMSAYFRAVHYLTSISRGLKDADAASLAALPASVQQRAWAWIDVYRPFISPPRSALIWTGGTMPAVAPYAKHPTDGRSVFPLSWGLDNEVLESTVLHTLWPEAEQVNRLHPSGVDVASVYGNAFARTLLAPDLKASPNLAPVLDGLMARRPKIAESSSVYERWLDALGAEWADSLRFPGAPATSSIWNVKRLQTGLASWATLREATILVNERADAAEGGEGGFEELILEEPRGYVEPAPKTFQAIAGLYESLAKTVTATSGFEADLRAAIVQHLDSSAAEARRFAGMAEHELRGEALTSRDYANIQAVGGSAEHQFLIYKSLGVKDEGIPKPDPMPKIADVAGDPGNLGVLEVAVGYPIEWRQIVPYFGRREIVIGAIYSYHEFVSNELYDNERWRKEVGQHPHPAWVQPLIAPPAKACTASGAR